MAQVIPANEVRFHPHSFADPDGRLFRWKGQLYRGICASWAPVFQRLRKDGLLGSLAERGLLIETELVPLKMEGYEFLVQHRSLPFVSYPQEWCAAMLCDAVRLMLDLSEELARHGLTLKDGHPWNVLFDGTRPVFVDLTSIRTQDERTPWPACHEIGIYGLNPLLLMAAGQDRIARLLLCEEGGVTETDLLTLKRGAAMANDGVVALGRKVLQKGVNSMARQLRKKAGRQSQLDMIAEMRRRLEAIRWDKPAVQRESNASARWHETVQTILKDLSPRTVLDLGSGASQFARTAGEMGSHAVVFDSTLDVAGRLYADAKAGKEKYLPLWMDITKPTPSRGILDHYFISAVERYRCDLVLALGVVHRLAFQRHFDFQHIVEAMTQFSSRWLLVEFVPRDDAEIHVEQERDYSWYTLDKFQSALNEKMRVVRVMPSPTGHRVLLLCEK